MRLYDIVAAPWAITSDMFQEVQGMYSRHMRGEKIDIGALEAKIGRPLANAPKPLVKDGSVAVISIEGVLAKRANLMSQISGGTSMQMMGSQLAEALADPSVTAIVLSIDSPGGTVDGTEALANQVYAARDVKPIYAHTDGIMASAAYWIGSAASAVYISGDTVAVGSIGVIATHVDQSMAEAQQGIRVTEVKAGKFKGAGSTHKPLGTAEITLQASVDHIYDVFTATVARNRAVSQDTVKADMAEGQMFQGQKAIEAGLVDGVATLSQVIAHAAAALKPSAGLAAVSAGVAPQAFQSTEELPMSTETTPAVAAAVPADVIATASAAAATAERERITSVLKLKRKGHEALVEQLAFDGKTTGPEAAVQVLAAMDAASTAKLVDLHTDAAAAAVAAPVAAAEPTEAAIDPIAIAKAATVYKAERAAAGVTVTDTEAVDHILKGAK